MKSQRNFESPCPIPANSCAVIGFLGGVDRWDDAAQGVRRAALRIRNHAKNRYVETFENRNVDLAWRFLEATGVIGERVRNDVVIVIYGQSLGGAAAIRLARRLKSEGLAVALTVQVDSVGLGHDTIPGNVRYAANFFEKEGLLIRGVSNIRATDPNMTVILGNWRWKDEGIRNALPLTKPWWKTFFQRTHLRMVHDVRVWTDVERLVISCCEGRDLASVAESIAAHWD